MDWILSIVQKPTISRKIMIEFIWNSGHREFISGVLKHDDRTGKDLFVLDCGGMYDIDKCPRWAYVKLPND